MEVKYLLLIVTAVFFASCNPRYKDFDNHSEELYIQLHQFGDQKDLTLCAAYESVLSVKLRLKRENAGSFDYWNDYSYQQITDEALGNIILGDFLCKTHQGDSLSLIFPYHYMKESLLDDYFTDEVKIADTTMMQMELKVIELNTKVSKQKQLEEDYRKGKLLEDDFLRKHLQTEGVLEDCMFKHGVYITKTKETSGDTVKYGRDLGVDYKGYFLDGTLFDNTMIDSTTLYFQLGVPDQVIRGISIALGYLKEGEEARVYMPSYLGFGKRGSTDGRVPPNTPIFFDLIVTDVFTPEEIKVLQLEK